MTEIQNRLQRTVTRLRNLKRADIIDFIKKSKKPIFYSALGMAIFMIALAVGTYAYFVRDLTSKERIINRKNAGVVLLDRNDKPFFTLFDAKTKNPIAFDDIPERTTQAFVAVEDKDFFNHPGFSVTGIGRAIRTNLLSESYSQGGSTISQQLIKNALLSPDKKLLRKYQELVLALELERRYSKNDILEMYVNTIYFGEGAFGLQDASQAYFSKDAQNLTLAESALLAGIIRAPSALSPISGSYDAALKRKDLILGLMAEQKYITQAEKVAAQKQKMVLKPNTTGINKEGVHFALMVQDELIEEYGEQTLAQSGFTVKTTIDLELQQKAQQAVATQVQRLASSEVTNGAAVAIDPKTGEILALIGSHDWTNTKNGKINMAVRARQPGSSFKPIIYAEALEEKLITASTKIKDEAIKFGTYEPKNYDNKFRGEVSIRYALANSLNIPAVLVLDMLGVDAGVQAAKDLGITSLSDDREYGLPLVLGAAEVPLVEMTNAYAVFANQGIWNEYSTFLEVKDKTGQVILIREPETQEALSSSVAFIISDILSDTASRQDTFGGALNLSRKAAVKTGTTNDYKDALTIGYTPQVVVGVWIGNNDNTPMNSIAGSLGAAPIWRQIMEAYLQDKPIANFTKPSSVTDQQVCKEDGLKVDFATSSAYLEYFVRGTVPTKLCGVPSPTPTGGETPKPTEDPQNKPTDTPAPAPSATAAPVSPTTGITATPPATTPSSTPIIEVTISE